MNIEKIKNVENTDTFILLNGNPYSRSDVYKKQGDSFFICECGTWKKVKLSSESLVIRINAPDIFKEANPNDLRGLLLKARVINSEKRKDPSSEEYFRIPKATIEWLVEALEALKNFKVC